MYALAVAAIASGCAPIGDNASAQRQAEKRRKANIRAMEAATSQTRRGQDVEGEDLRALVIGKTHVFEYERGPTGTTGPYITYSYFRPDGRYVFINGLWAVDPEGNEKDTWRVEGARLCVLDSSFSSTEQCFSLAVTPGGRIQYYISNPGDPSDGLLTKIPNRVIDGPPPS